MTLPAAWGFLAAGSLVHPAPGESAMPILLNCLCGRKLRVRDEFAGQQGQCPACGKTLQIPLDGEATFPGPRAVPVVEAVPAPDALPAERPPSAPDGTLANHGGGPIPDDADFFADPPDEIGPVTSAHTTLLQGKRHWTPGGRLVLVGLCGLGGLAAGALAVLVFRVRNDFGQFALPTLPALLAALVALICSGFRHTCSYVGREGVARFTCSGHRRRLTKQEVFRFRDATDLRTGQTRQYVNGVYTGTNYHFTWTDVGGRKRYRVGGTYKNQKGNPPTADPFHFGKAAELAWTGYLLDQARRQVELAGSVVFQLARGHWVRLGPGLLTYCLGGEEVTWPAEEIAGAQVDQGVVRVRRVDAREGWLSSRGVLKFPFDTLANAQLFFHLLGALARVRVG